MSINKLKSMFPAIPISKLEDILAENDNDLEAAVSELLKMSSSSSSSSENERKNKIKT